MLIWKFTCERVNTANMTKQKIQQLTQAKLNYKYVLRLPGKSIISLVWVNKITLSTEL